MPKIVEPTHMRCPWCGKYYNIRRTNQSAYYYCPDHHVELLTREQWEDAYNRLELKPHFHEVSV